MKILTSLLLTSMTLSLFGAEGYDPAIFKTSVLNTPQKIKILNHGLASFEERLQLIERAEKTIDVEYFIYNSDTSGKIITQALVRKAKEGVKVRLLLDYFLIRRHITTFHAEELAKYGIEVKYYNRTTLFNILGKGQYRDHRKVLIIDGKVALTGGRNIGDEYFDLSTKFNFLDRDIEVEGPLVDSMQDTFDAVWNSKVSKKLSRPKMPSERTYNMYDDYDRERYENDLKEWKKSEKKAQDFLSQESIEANLVEAIRAKGKEELQTEYQGECQNMTYSSEYPITNRKNRTERIIKNDLYDRIRNAKKTVLLESPYFVEEKSFREALTSALKNNIEVKLLTNGLYSTDAVYVFDVFDTIIKQWVKRGLDPYVFGGDSPKNYDTLNSNIENARFGVHAKTYVFDNEDVVIGTFNLDPHSFNYSTEMVLSCENNPELAKFITADIEERMGESIRINTQEAIDKTRFYRVSLLKKLSYYLLKVPAQIFDYLL